jgi:hypothetical protein
MMEQLRSSIAPLTECGLTILRSHSRVFNSRLRDLIMNIDQSSKYHSCHRNVLCHGESQSWEEFYEPVTSLLGVDEMVDDSDGSSHS